MIRAKAANKHQLKRLPILTIVQEQNTTSIETFSRLINSGFCFSFALKVSLEDTKQQNDRNNSPSTVLWKAQKRLDTFVIGRPQRHYR